jgi:hypothetical protein
MPANLSGHPAERQIKGLHLFLVGQHHRVPPLQPAT